ncbi:MAG: hypothetical protein MJE68_27790, partial [Proteobacteria bacterium]|nr:hypothetical protein [Pseudomonadota bacterium]
MTSLRWLKQNNPLYANIDINEEWLEQAVSNDEDLFGGLVAQCDTNDLDNNTDDMKSESVLCTQQPNEPSIDGNSSSNQFVDKYDSRSMEYHPNSLSSDDNLFSIAFNVLEQVATENGFAIHNVPFDGDCLFSSIAYQLEPITACSIKKNTLRQMVVDYLKNNSNLYKRFVSQPVVSNNSYNADTEPPTAQDEQIETIADHELQVELHWENYVQRLKDGAWGDHIAIQAIYMFKVTVNVLSSQNPTMTPILPRSYINCDSEGE